MVFLFKPSTETSDLHFLCLSFEDLNIKPIKRNISVHSWSFKDLQYFLYILKMISPLAPHCQGAALPPCGCTQQVQTSA